MDSMDNFGEAIYTVKSILFDILLEVERRLEDIDIQINRTEDNQKKESLKSLKEAQETKRNEILKLTNKLMDNLNSLNSYDSNLSYIASDEEQASLVEETEDDFTNEVEDVSVTESVEVPVSSEEVVPDEVEVAPVAESVEVPVSSEEVGPDEVEVAPAAESVEVPVSSEEVVPDEVEVAPAAENVEVPVSSEINVPNTTIVSVPSIPATETTVTDNNSSQQLSDLNIQLPIVDALKHEQGQITPVPNATQVNETFLPQTNPQSSSYIKFIKNGNEVGKAILTTSEQFAKLKGSCGTQKALLNLKGSLTNNSSVGNTNNTLDGDVTEQQLINNGLLEPTHEDLQKKIEIMLAQANELYRNGDAKAAQEMYNQISILNKQLQESTGIKK